MTKLQTLLLIALTPTVLFLIYSISVVNQAALDHEQIEIVGYNVVFVITSFITTVAVATTANNYKP